MQRKVQSRVQYEQVDWIEEVRAGRAERDRVLYAMAEARPTVVEALQAYARHLWRELRRPLSANDVRPVLARIEYAGDPRILRHAFPRKEWEVVGWDTHAAPGNHARRICTFAPRAGVDWAETSVERPGAG